MTYEIKSKKIINILVDKLLEEKKLKKRPKAVDVAWVIEKEAKNNKIRITVI